MKRKRNLSKKASERSVVPKISDPEDLDWWNGQKPDFNSRGRILLSNLLNLDPETFENEYWLKKPYVRHLTLEERTSAFSNPGHPVHMLSMNDIRSLLSRKKPRPPRFLHDVDVTRYVDNKREALVSGEGEVNATTVWDAYNNDDYSIRLVHPQQWHHHLFQLCSSLQEYFGSTTGCSSYLTPKNSQGFPPHYDDVEIFVVQLEGKKKWRLYDRPDAPTNPTPRVTTEFPQSELGVPTAELTLCAGDVLYFPRGTVHQAVSCEDEHSLHLTFSTYQKNTWYDLLTTVVKEETKKHLEQKAKESCWIHEGLPLKLFDNVMVGSPLKAWEVWGKFLGDGNLHPDLLKWLSVPGRLGKAIDLRATEFLFHCLPPPPQKKKNSKLQIEESDKIKLKSKYSLRLINESTEILNGTFEQWNEIETDEDPNYPSLRMVLNTSNGKAFNSPPSPMFEVLPFLAKDVCLLLDSDGKEIDVEVFESIQDEEVKEDMLDLLTNLLNFNAIEICE